MPTQVIQKCVSANAIGKQGKAFVATTSNNFAARARADQDLLEAPTTAYLATRYGNRFDDIGYYVGMGPSGI